MKSNTASPHTSRPASPSRSLRGRILGDKGAEVNGSKSKQPEENPVARLKLLLVCLNRDSFLVYQSLIAIYLDRHFPDIAYPQSGHDTDACPYISYSRYHRQCSRALTGIA
jgi:hypothetical protein